MGLALTITPKQKATQLVSFFLLHREGLPVFGDHIVMAKESSLFLVKQALHAVECIGFPLLIPGISLFMQAEAIELKRFWYQVWDHINNYSHV